MREPKFEVYIDAAKEYRFIALDDFNYRNFVQSAVMSWNGDMSHLHDEFSQTPQYFMDNYPGGDQDFIRDYEDPVLWQDILGEKVIQSYKVHIRRNKVDPMCRVVCYHGKPKGWDINRSTGKPYDDELRS